MIQVANQVEAARSVLDLSSRLGAACRKEGRWIKEALEDEVAAREATRLEKTVAATKPALWHAAVGMPDGLRDVMDDELIDLIESMRPHHPLDYLAVLRGLCHRTLPEIYLTASGKIVLDEGTPVPFATRPVNQLFKSTPYQKTLSHGHLLGDLNFWPFAYPAGGGVRVAFDFAHRERIDEIGWVGSERLPRIATLHPAGRDFVIEHQTDDEFFGVRPASWDREQMRELLLKSADAEIAVLPELSLPQVDALEELLGEDPESYPPLVVAGSAHMLLHASAGRETRANESRIYLDGECIATHRKCHPFVLKMLEGKKLDQPLRESLTGEAKTITVLCGRRTRLAVVICADLDDHEIPGMLVSAGVNLLLVPSMTVDPGAFNGAICGVASRCQGVAAVANAQLDAAALGGEDPLFLLMAAVPRPGSKEQSDEFPAPAGEAREHVAVFDPNQRLSRAISWL